MKMKKTWCRDLIADIKVTGLRGEWVVKAGLVRMRA